MEVQLRNSDITVIFFPMAQEPLVGQGLLIIEASRSHSDIPHSVGLLWTSDHLLVYSFLPSILFRRLPLLRSIIVRAINPVCPGKHARHLVPGSQAHTRLNTTDDRVNYNTFENRSVRNINAIKALNKQ